MLGAQGTPVIGVTPLGTIIGLAVAVSCVGVSNALHRPARTTSRTANGKLVLQMIDVGSDARNELID